MKFSTTFLALFAAIAVWAMLDQADARVGGDRDLNLNEMYTVYFANSCNSDVKVQINSGHKYEKRGDGEQTILANSCEVFQRGHQYEGPMITYTVLDIDGATQVVSCESSYTNLCNLYGMNLYAVPGENVCVIKVDTCPPKPVPPTDNPTKSPTRAPTYAPVKQCGRSCKTTYDCANDNGFVCEDECNNAWCSGECRDGCCQVYDFCRVGVDSDCDQNTSVCGKHGICVGK